MSLYVGSRDCLPVSPLYPAVFLLQVRLLCWTNKCDHLRWGEWLDRDNPGGSCDCEHPGWADHPVRNAPACPDGKTATLPTSSTVNSTCGPESSCTCQAGFWNYRNQECRPEVVLGGGCLYQEDCSSHNPVTVCEEGLCSCPSVTVDNRY
ncbi:hypothetical protein FJT64_005127 [Amphibalanus amphitrite]|uniref:EB domain-containing protein n=1 Tax=Amphibalanus amphitrite TaxID=1232801 RepID=A0A6A4VRU6_AMPAM|nr:hypothetical protein FJT64_005127 [Amphibalanus amphitrite]